LCVEDLALHGGKAQPWYMMVKGESRNSRTRGVILKRE
jgi:hypothetical protein